MSNGEKGSVLLLAIWVLALLGFVAASLSFRQSMTLKLAEYPWDELRMREIARTAVCVGAVAWRKQTGASLDLKDQTTADGSFTLHAEDESARVNLNKASPQSLEQLWGSHAGVVADLLRRRTARSFRSVEELLLVNGMTWDILKDIRDNITLYTSGAVNINTASAEVLTALGLDAGVVAKIIALRNGPDGFFMQVGEILPKLKDRFFLSDRETDSLSGILKENRLTTRSEACRFRILVRLKDGSARRYSVVTPTAGSSDHPLLWREVL